ncbi:MAG: hypothetical protein MP439_06710 [Ferrimicrobium sp.]|nr:hypothetical protein [Ferrimicrobium sp.]
MRDTFAKMGVLEFADADLGSIEAEDNALAGHIDELRRSQAATKIAAGEDS